MIVKDESEHLAQCLESIQGLADEVCIVDTGSKDNTVEIARLHGAKISFFIWCDNFAAARNESLRGCGSDWIFILDADERITPEDIARIRALADGPLNVCYRFSTRNYTNTDSVGDFQRSTPDDPNARGFAGWYPSTKVRLFPNNTGAQFEGKVHELINNSLSERGVRIDDCDIPVHHYPYMRSPERIIEKQAQYLQLGQDKIAANPQDPKAYQELGSQYAEMRDYPNAAAAFRDSLKIDPANPIALKDLGGVLHLLRKSEEAKRALRLSLELDPGLSDAWRNLGVIYADEKDWPLSIECFERAVGLNPDWADGYRYLSVALAGGGRLADAVVMTQRALEMNPDSKEALMLYLHQTLRLEQRSEARAFLKNLLQKGAANPAIYDALGELSYYDQLYEEAKGHFTEAAKHGIVSAFNNLGVVLYHQGRYADARDAFEKCLAADPTHRGARTNLEKSLAHLRAK